VAAQQREGKTMATEVFAGASQLLFVPFDTQRAKQLRTGLGG